MSAIWVIVRKEWKEVFRDKNILIMSIVLPVIFVAMPAGFLYFIERSAQGSGGIPEGFNDAGAYAHLMQLPQFQGMSELRVFEIVMLDQFLLYFLMIPLMLPVFVAVYSIVGEKQQRSLEPLLATPISVTQLLSAKTLAGSSPAVVITWASFALTVAVTALLTTPEVARIMLAPTWLLAMIVLSPLLTVAAVIIGVIISSRVNDVRLAEQIGGLIVLPLVALTIPVLMGKLLLSARFFAIGCALTAVLDVALLFVGVRLFQRETILTRWSQ